MIRRQTIQTSFVCACTMLCMTLSLSAQERKGKISGTVVDATNQVALQSVAVRATSTDASTTTDEIGNFSLEVPVGRINLEISLEGYEVLNRFNIEISSAQEKRYVFELNRKKVEELDEVVVSSVKRTVKAATLQTPLSVQKLTAEEIVRMPGGNFDLSRAVQSLPGVAGTRGSSGGYRNDIIVRGGATNENVYYLDGIEVPVLNHFNTQGGSGGVEGILNVYFVENMTLSSSAFNARYDNALSSVFEIKQRKGNFSKVQGNLRSSVLESQLTLDGPIGKSKKASFIASARTSYLDFLFGYLDLPIRPNYIDYQFKVSYQINPKTALTFIGFGAIDNFFFVKPKNADARKLYLLNSLPLIDQSSLTLGVSLQRALQDGYLNIALSMNTLKNEVTKKNTLIEGREKENIFRTASTETEIKLRANFYHQKAGWNISYGVMGQLPIYFNDFMQTRFVYTNGVATPVVVQFTANANFFRYGFYGQVGRNFFNNKVGINLGIRFDANTFTHTGNEFWKTTSPRFSFSYSFHPKWKINFTTGMYFKLLPYNTLFYKKSDGSFVNQNTDYTQSNHLAFGLEYLPSLSTRVTLEGFYKSYSNVPVSVKNGVSISNLGVDYGSTGNEEVRTTGNGEVYGIEFFGQQKLLKNFFLLTSYTFFRSYYSGIDNVLRPASWDFGHLGTLTFLIVFPRNWSLGMRFQVQGAAPYTPFDETKSRADYLSSGQGVLDYTKINTLRLNFYHSGDLRVEKKWFWKNHTINLYFLVSNFYFAQTSSYPYYSFERNKDNTAFVTTDGSALKPDGSNARQSIIYNDLTTVVPSVGIIWEFK